MAVAPQTSSRDARGTPPEQGKKESSLTALIRGLNPKETVFFDLLEASAENLVDATEQFAVGLRSDDAARFVNLRKLIKAFEHQGDEYTHKIQDQIDRTFVTPIEREDILALAHAMDDVVDCLDTAAARLELYQVDGVLPLAVKMGDLLDEGAKALLPLIQGLRYMADVSGMRKRIRVVTKLESKSDIVFHAALAALFDDPKDPIYLIKWKEIFEQLEEAMDRIELVAKVVGSTVMRNA
jgi:uncharacterized protein Yka (UPF0111/DUF47 family)